MAPSPRSVPGGRRGRGREGLGKATAALLHTPSPLCSSRGSTAGSLTALFASWGWHRDAIALGRRLTAASGAERAQLGALQRDSQSSHRSRVGFRPVRDRNNTKYHTFECIEAQPSELRCPSITISHTFERGLQCGDHAPVQQTPFFGTRHTLRQSAAIGAEAAARH